MAEGSKASQNYLEASYLTFGERAGHSLPEVNVMPVADSSSIRRSNCKLD